jgi:hypothetical protein
MARLVLMLVIAAGLAACSSATVVVFSPDIDRTEKEAKK